MFVSTFIFLNCYHNKDYEIGEECRTQFVKSDPCVPGPEECETVYDMVCDTRQKVHEVEDDVVNCETVYEKKCENVPQGNCDE